MRAKLKGFIIFILCLSLWGGLPWSAAVAQVVDPPPPPPIPLPLGDIPVPAPELNGIVRNLALAKVLGKALFWDMQAGSDNQACASCHFHAGADSRAKNQLNPDLLRVTDPGRADDADLLFGTRDNPVYNFTVAGSTLGLTAGQTFSGGTAGPNYTLVPEDFPFHVLDDPENRNSAVLFDMNDVASSQGTFDGMFTSIILREIEEICDNPDGIPFNVDGVPIRKVEPRNTPTTINAVFNHRNFWDGRANNIFNGVDPLGRRSPDARVLKYDPVTRGAVLENLLDDDPLDDADGDGDPKNDDRIKNASLASQSVGPPLSDFEMSCAGREFPDLGRKLLSLRPLALQDVHIADSLLGAWRHSSGKGLRVSYARLIMAAFHPNYWAARGRFTIDPGPTLVSDPAGYTQMELNFSLYFGLAVQLYEATLVGDQTPFDVFREANPLLVNNGEGTVATAAVTFPDLDNFGSAELRGLDVFLNKGKCINCHFGAEFTGASVRLRANQPDGNEEPIERMPMQVGVALYDGGFYNIGVRPTFEDLGVGGDINGPLSFARQIVTGNVIDNFNFDPAKFEVPGPIVSGERVAVDGAFKVPTVRNVELTGPYMHNGGEATLMDVVEFYDRGGNRKDNNDCNPTAQGDTSGFGNAGDLSECSNLDPDIVNLGLTGTEPQDLVAFMIALTDPRVKDESEPFDHPQLFVSNGQVDTDPATDIVLEIPAVGAAGRAPGDEIGTFLGLDPFALSWDPGP